MITQWAWNFLNVYAICYKSNGSLQKTVMLYFPNVTKWKMSWFSSQQPFSSIPSDLVCQKVYQNYWSDLKWYGHYVCWEMCSVLCWFYEEELIPYAHRCEWERQRSRARMLQLVKMKSAMFSCLCRAEVSSIGNGKWHICMRKIILEANTNAANILKRDIENREEEERRKKKPATAQNLRRIKRENSIHQKPSEGRNVRQTNSTQFCHFFRAAQTHQLDSTSSLSSKTSSSAQCSSIATLPLNM